MMVISQHLFFIDVFHAVYNMHKFYRKILNYQPIVSVKYCQGYDEKTAVQSDEIKYIFPWICIFLCEILHIVWYSDIQPST